MEKRNDTPAEETHKQDDLGLKMVKLGEWEMTYATQPRIFTKENVRDGLRVISEWETAFAQENTWVRNNHNVPSLIVRLDSTIVDGQLEVYEVEERPSGIGITSLVNPQFKDHLQAMKNVWPNFEGIISDDPRRRGGDDHLWLPIGDRGLSSELVLVRAEPEETDFHHLEERSVSSIKEKGNKAYGLEMGMWRNVSQSDELDFDDSFVIKPIRGSKTRDVFIYVPKRTDPNLGIPDLAKAPGTYSRGKVERVVNESRETGGMYCQPFYPPIESQISDEYRWMIYRVFFGYNPESKEWECMGGSWNARQNLKIHGAGDSLCGPVMVEE